MPDMYDVDEFRADLSIAIACMTSGLHEAIPEHDDMVMAQKMIDLYEEMKDA